MNDKIRRVIKRLFDECQRDGTTLVLCVFKGDKVSASFVGRNTEIEYCISELRRSRDAQVERVRLEHADKP